MVVRRTRRRFVALGLVVAVVGLLPGGAARAAAGSGGLHGVIEDASGHPLAGASVRLTDASGAVAAAVVADAAGRFSAGVAPGAYDITVDQGTGASAAHGRVAAVAVGDDTALDIALAGPSLRPSVFSGRLRDAAGAPLPFVRIEAGQSTITDEDGRFTLAVRPDHYRLGLRIPGPDANLDAAVENFDLTGDHTVDWTVPVAAVDVFTHDGSGRPFEGVEVSIGAPSAACAGCGGTARLFPGGPIGAWSSIARSRADGHTHLTALAGTGVDANAGAYGWHTPRQSATITAPATTLDFTETADPAPAPVVGLSGTARDADGTPLQSVTLETAAGATVAWAQIAADGTYELTAPPGTYTLAAKASRDDGGLDHTDWASTDLTLSQFRLDHDGQVQDVHTPGTTARVRVTDAAGRPVPGALVVSTSGPTTGSGGDLYTGPWRVTAAGAVPTDATGIAVVRTALGAATTFTVDAPADRGLDTSGKIPTGATDAGAVLPAGVGLTVHLHNPDGSAAAVDHVVLVTADKKKVAAALTPGGAGTYTARVNPAHYLLGIDGDPDQEGESNDISAWNIGDVAVDVTADRTLDLTLPAHPVGGQVRFVDSQGQPVDITPDRGMHAATAPGAVTLGAGVTATASAAVYLMGESDAYDLPLVAPAEVQAKITSPFQVDVAHLPLAPGGHLVVALPSGTTPSPPGGVRAVTATATGPSTVSVGWQPPADDHGSPILGYLVEAGATDGPDSEGPFHPRRFVPAGCSGVDLTGLDPGHNIEVIVEAVNGNGIGPWGLDSVTYVDTPPGSPSGPAPKAPCVPAAATPGDAPGPGLGPVQAADGPAGAALAGRAGYWALARDGHVYSFGDAPALGNAVGEAADLEPTPTGRGYWVLTRAGRVIPFGDAAALGDVAPARLAKGEEPASLSATPSGNGYWVFTNRGRAFAFGDAPLLGDMGATKLNGPVLGSVATPTGKGYFMVASDGGIFAFGDAVFAGSMGGKRLNAPVQSLVPDADGRGYWLVASDGGIFAFDALFHGSMGDRALNRPVSGMVRYGDGYLMVGEDGGIFNFSTRPFAGSLGDRPPTAPVVAVAAMP